MPKNVKLIPKRGLEFDIGSTVGEPGEFMLTTDSRKFFVADENGHPIEYGVSGPQGNQGFQGPQGHTNPTILAPFFNFSDSGSGSFDLSNEQAFLRPELGLIGNNAILYLTSGQDVVITCTDPYTLFQYFQESRIFTLIISNYSGNDRILTLVGLYHQEFVFMDGDINSLTYTIPTDNTLEISFISYYDDYRGSTILVKCFNQIV